MLSRVDQYVEQQRVHELRYGRGRRVAGRIGTHVFQCQGELRDLVSEAAEGKEKHEKDGGGNESSRGRGNEGKSQPGQHEEIGSIFKECEQ